MMMGIAALNPSYLADIVCIINIHQICWQECLRKEGPPETFP